jgi:oxygen-dependent protoporphyrinogen oxidase
MPSKLPDEFFITLLRSAYSNSCHGAIRRRPTVAWKLPAARALSFLAVNRTRPIGPRRAQHLSRPLSIGGIRGYATVKPPASSKKLTKSKKAAAPEPRKIAILGGGITGLTAAHYLARHATNAHITVYEASDRLGGWIDGQHMETGQGKEDDVLLQRGPRMLRTGATSNKYDDLVLYDVVSLYQPTA